MEWTSLAQLIRIGSQKLVAASVGEPKRDATLLLQVLLGVDQIYLLVNPRETVPPEVETRYLELIERRSAGEPIQYITGHQEFYGLDFAVTPAVVIPRPETELIVDAVLETHQQVHGTLGQEAQKVRIVDVGTGSGCLAVTLARHIPEALLIAIDVSMEALRVAAENARRHGVADRIGFLQSDLLSCLSRVAGERTVDFVISNPPYVRESEWASLNRAVRDYEPRIALVSGASPHHFHQRLFSDCALYLRECGFLICEIGAGQYPEVLERVDDNQFSLIEMRKDLQGIPRTLVLQKRT